MATVLPITVLPPPSNSLAYSELGLEEDEQFIHKACSETVKFATACLNGRVDGVMLFGVKRSEERQEWRVCAS